MKIQDIVKSNLRYRKPNFTLSKEELMELDKELSNFKNDKGVVIEKDWLISRGALTKDGSVVIEHYSPAEKDCSPILYEELTEKYSQWCDWVGLKKYAIKKDLENLELSSFGKI